MKLAVKENPTESHVSSLLAREYILRNDIKNAIKQYLATLKYDDINTPEKNGIKLDCF